MVNSIVFPGFVLQSHKYFNSISVVTRVNFCCFPLLFFLVVLKWFYGALLLLKKMCTLIILYLWYCALNLRQLLLVYTVMIISVLTDVIVTVLASEWLQSFKPVP